MTQKEFEEGIGRTVSVEEYAFADNLYLHCDMDKQAFYEQYNVCGGTKLVKELADTIASLNRRYERVSTKEKEEHIVNERLRGLMLGIADRLYKIVIKLVEPNTKDVLLLLADELILDECHRLYYKCRNGIQLNEHDLQALEYNLGIGELAAEEANTIDKMAIG